MEFAPLYVFLFLSGQLKIARVIFTPCQVVQSSGRTVHKRLVLSEINALFPETGVLSITDDSAMQK